MPLPSGCDPRPVGVRRVDGKRSVTAAHDLPAWEHQVVDREAALAGVRDELARGEYLLAYDAARDAAAAFPDDLHVRYYAVLALARAGAGERAAEELETSGLPAAVETGAPAPLAEDVAALGARLAKDRAVHATGDARRLLAAEAAARYEALPTVRGSGPDRSRCTARVCLAPPALPSAPTGEWPPLVVPTARSCSATCTTGGPLTRSGSDRNPSFLTFPLQARVLGAQRSARAGGSWLSALAREPSLSWTCSAGK